jgi:hypothetical protein
MSTYTVEKLPDDPIIYCWFSESWKAVDLPAVFEEVAAILDVEEKPLTLITCAQDIDLTIEDVISTANLATRQANSLLRHPNLREFVFVTKVKLLQLAARGLNSDIFGNVSVKIFDLEEEAFAYARGKLLER